MKTKDKESLLLIGIGLILFYLLYKVDILIYLSAIISLIGITSPYLTNKISILWFWVGKKIGLLVSALILTLVFFIVLTPVALIFKLFKKTEIINKEQTNFKERNHHFSPLDFEKTW